MAADRGDLQQIRGTSVFLSGDVYVMENDSQEPVCTLQAVCWLLTKSM